MRLPRALSAGVVLLLTGCAAQAPVKVASAPPPDPATQMPALERRIYEAVEAERHKLDPNAQPLALDSELVGVAREKSADMAARHYLAHAAPDGQTSASLIMDKDAAFQGLLGENIAAQPFLKNYGVDVDAFAGRIVSIWLTSKPHRANLADPAYRRTGIGAAVSGDTIYVTELFSGDVGTAAAPPPAIPAGQRR